MPHINDDHGDAVEDYTAENLDKENLERSTEALI